MNDDLKQRVQDLKNNQQLVATYEVKERSKSPPYITVGNGIATKAFPDSVAVDTIRVLNELTKEQRGLVADLKDILVEQWMSDHYSNRISKNPNLITLQRKGNNECHDNISKRMSEHRNCTELTEKGVLVKVKNRQYMLNPYMFIPSKDFKQIEELWREYTTTE
ncbi:MAG: hypothetical protein GY861_19235 [bacterium]|nr:hypothetical protein [bacterium]